MDAGNILALALAGSALALGLLAGVWLGFRIVTRDAALLATLDRRVGQALTVSSEAKARADLLDATWQEHLAELERKRKKAATERQRADAASEKAEAHAATPEQEHTPELTPRERRRQLARIANGRVA